MFSGLGSVTLTFVILTHHLKKLKAVKKSCLKNRNYLNRHELLLKENYNPYEDITHHSEGYLSWTDSVSPDLKLHLKDYFSSRVEDS